MSRLGSAGWEHLWGTLQVSPSPGLFHSRHLDSGSSERPDISSIKRRIQVTPRADMHLSSPPCHNFLRGGPPRGRWVP